ncbi:MAG: hypothetical protein E7642_01725 [Ruminococcaceae bacterium]|nr:hypothetical protein [Oscillospiraceae bacterium]
MEFVPEEPPTLSELTTDATDASGETLEAVTEAITEVTEKFPSKLEQFLEPTESVDYSLLIPLVFLLLLSALLGRVFKKLPQVCFGISLLPALMIAYMYEAEMLYEQAALFLILGALHVIGNIVDCLLRDREDGRHRASIAAKISSAAGAFACFFVLWKGAQTPPADPDKIGHIENRIFFHMTGSDVGLLTQLGWMFVILFAVSIILYNVYFIDAIVSVVPFCFVTYQLAAEYLTLAPTVFFTLALFCLLTHLAIAVFENNLSRKEQGLPKFKTKTQGE